MPFIPGGEFAGEIVEVGDAVPAAGDCPPAHSLAQLIPPTRLYKPPPPSLARLFQASHRQRMRLRTDHVSYRERVYQPQRRRDIRR